MFDKLINMMANLWIFCWCFKHVLKAKLFANLANSTEVVPLKRYRGHHRCTKDCNQLTNQAFQVGFCWHKQRVRLYQTSSQNISYISIYSDSDVRCTSCTLQSLSLISGFLFWWNMVFFFWILRDLIIASKHRTDWIWWRRWGCRQSNLFGSGYLSINATIEGVPSKFCGVPQKTLPSPFKQRHTCNKCLDQVWISETLRCPSLSQHTVEGWKAVLRIPTRLCFNGTIRVAI